MPPAQENLLSGRGFPAPGWEPTLELTTKAKTCPRGSGHWETRGNGEREEGGKGRKETPWCGLRRQTPGTPGTLRPEAWALAKLTCAKASSIPPP